MNQEKDAHKEYASTRIARFNPATNSWAEDSNLVSARLGHSIIKVADSVLIVGGLNTNDTSVMKVSFLFNSVLNLINLRRNDVQSAPDLYIVKSSPIQSLMVSATGLRFSSFHLLNKHLYNTNAYFDHCQRMNKILLVITGGPN